MKKSLLNKEDKKSSLKNSHFLKHTQNSLVKPEGAKGAISKKNFLSADLQALPSGCGVYLMKDIQARVIYIGKAKNIKSRVSSYFSKDQSLKNIFLTPKIHHVDYILTETEAEAFLLEATMVKKHRPKYNIRLKDDKSYPYIRLSREDSFPRFYMERRVKKKGSLYFGPYTEAHVAKSMIGFLNEHFKIRDCSNHFMKNRTKPCLSYEMGRCTAPCVKKVSLRVYGEQVQKAKDFLTKGSGRLLKSLKQKMKTLSERQRFEEALRVKNQIRSMEFARGRSSVVGKNLKDMDVIAFYREGESVLFEVLCVRTGSLVGHKFHFVSRLPVKDTPVFSFVMQYYMDNVLPQCVLVPVQKNKKICEEALFRMHGKNTKLISDLSSHQKQLMAMAFKNAKNHFKDHIRKVVSLKEGLREIQKKMGLREIPERMECFDISHLQGRQTVASQVVFEGGVPLKAHYRRYRLRTIKGVDDFSSIKEVLDRRLKHKEMKDPDLIVVDGGRGQLQKASLALKEVGREDLALVAMAKAKTDSDFRSSELSGTEERFFIPGRKNPLVFPPHSQALKILIQLRDEAHRFAISYHRLLRQKDFLKP